MNSQLQNYIEREILPLYLSFDKAHNIDHINQVISRSLNLAQHYDVDINMVYTIAAYHDLGLTAGREIHHIASGEILAADATLKQFFTPEQIDTMRAAVEDHRASAKSEPRTIYGRIVAEADRCIEPMTVIRRTIQFGIAHYPTLSTDEHFERCCNHLEEKYGASGYLKLWIPHSDNALRLEQLRAIAADKIKLRAIFDTIFSEEHK